MTLRQTAVVGALLGGLSVALGAFGAHGLTERLIALGLDQNLDQRLAWFETAVRYQFFHALACLAIGMAGTAHHGRLGAAAFCFLAGVALFCGSLYAMTFLGDAWRKLGAITPLGGLAFLIGWTLLAWSLAKPTR